MKNYDLNLLRLKYLKCSLMVADRVFIKRLRQWQFPDERLDVYFNEWRKQWEIWRFPRDGVSKPCVLTLLPALDQRGLLKMEERYYIHTSKSAGDLFHKLTALEEQRKELSERNFHNKIDSITDYHVDALREVTKRQVPINYEVT